MVPVACRKPRQPFERKTMSKILVKRGLDVEAEYRQIVGKWTLDLPHISKALQAAEQRLHLLKKKEYLGAHYEFLSAGPAEAAYGNSVNGIRVTATQTTSGIRIESIARTKRYPAQRQEAIITLNEEQKAKLAERSVQAIIKG